MDNQVRVRVADGSQYLQHQTKTIGGVETTLIGAIGAVVILLLLVGFPIALILAWAFDITAQGIRATPDTAAPTTRRRRNMIMLIATGVIVSAIAGFFLLPHISSARKIDKSIAVLPF